MQLGFPAGIAACSAIKPLLAQNNAIDSLKSIVQKGQQDAASVAALNNQLGIDRVGRI